MLCASSTMRSVGMVLCNDYATVESCTDRCLKNEGVAESQGEICLMSYRELMDCLGETVCGEASDWYDQRGGDFEYPCREGSDRVISSCNSLWPTDP